MTHEERLKQLSADFGDWWKKGYEIPEMTNNLYPYEKLFSPIRVNSITIKNRLVMGPWATSACARRQAVPTTRC